MTIRILLIDDDLLMGHLIRALVSPRGGEVVQVQNGKAGIEMAQASVYDHILVDLMLPHTDGLNVLRALYAQHHRGTRPKLTAISSRSHAEQKQACMAAGADQFLEKPLRPNALLDCVGL